MSEAANEIVMRALGLPPKERAEVMARLLGSMDGRSEAGVGTAWEAEIQRRLLADDSDDVDWNALRAEVDAKHGYR